MRERQHKQVKFFVLIFNIANDNFKNYNVVLYILKIMLDIYLLVGSAGYRRSESMKTVIENGSRCRNLETVGW